MQIKRLPLRLRPSAYRLRSFLMSDGVPLIILGVGVLLRGVSYIPRGPGGVVAHPAEGALPMTVWAAVWLSVGVLCLVAAVWHDGVLAALALGLGVGLNMLWAGSFFVASVNGTMPRGWVSAVGYVSIAVLVLWSTWRGDRWTAEMKARGSDH